MTYEHTRRTIGLTRAACASLSILALYGAACSSVGRSLPPPESYATVRGPIERGEYRIQVGDRLTVKFPYHSRMNQEVPVRPDGKISLESSGELRAEGMTPSELETLIKDRSSHRLRKPEVVVIVTQIGDHRVYVGGEVGRPGFVAVQEGMTPLQAVLAAGGFRDTAKKDAVLYIARAANGGYQATRVDLDDVVRNGAPETIRLAENDVVFVPATRIANLNVFMDQYVRKLLPVDSRMGASAALPGFQ